MSESPQRGRSSLFQANHLKWVFILQRIISSGEQRVEIKRSLLATYWINIRDGASGDVMWWGPDDHIADSASLKTRNQRPLDPPASMHKPCFTFIPNHPTHTRHTNHDCLPPELRLNPGKISQTFNTAHHTFASDLTRNPTFGAKQTLPWMIPIMWPPKLKVSFRFLVSTLPYNQVAVTVSQGWKSNKCILGPDVIWVSVSDANSN